MLIVLLIAVSIAGILAAMAANQITRALKDKELAKRDSTTVKCKRALEMVKDAMDVEYRVRGSYPYRFDDNFLDRFQTIDRWIFNEEIWSRDADSALELNTFLGKSYELTGWCRDGYVYHYDSAANVTTFESYSRKDLVPDTEQGRSSPPEAGGE